MAEAGVTVKQEPVEAVDLESRCGWCIQIGAMSCLSITAKKRHVCHCHTGTALGLGRCHFHQLQ